MKHFISIILAMCIMALLFSCDKQDESTQLTATSAPLAYVVKSEEARDLPKIESETGERIGTYYGLFYKESLTSDSVLVDNINRVQYAYNKQLIDSVFMVKVPGTNDISIGGVKHSVYNVDLLLVSGQIIKLGKFWSVKEGNNIRYKPFGNNVLDNTNKNVWVRVYKTLTTVSYFDYYFGIPKTKYQYAISGTAVPPGTDNLSATYLSGTIFILPHK